jgi:hypothetical protein
MTDIKDINHDDIKEFLTLNNIKVSNDENDYNKAFKLMKNPNIKVEPTSIVEWMMAYNLIIKKIKISDYTINDLMNFSISERDKLAKKLGMMSNNVINIINILHYLHKIHLFVGQLKIPNNKNIYNIFPKEIWIKILLDLNCKDIDRIEKESDQLNLLIIEQNIKEKIKTREFPRSSGHCAAIDVSEIIYNFEDVYKISNNQLKDKVLDILYDQNYNLIRGDLICFEGLNNDRNTGIYIFDGCKIIDLEYDIDDYGALPQEFTVINNGVPIRYWEDAENNKGISHNTLVWFDHISVKKQCIDNIIEIDGNLFTTFKYNDEIYKIYASRFEFDDETKLTKKQFIDILLKDDLLALNFNDEFYDEFEDTQNILYIAAYYYHNI